MISNVTNRIKGIDPSISKKVSITAGALVFVVFLLMLLTILLTSYILFVQYKQTLLFRQAQISQLDQNIESAVEIYQLNPGLFNNFQAIEIDIFPDNPSKVEVYQEPWGVYKIVRFSSTFKVLTSKRMAFFGNAWGSEEPFALYVTDKNSYLSICGKSVINGLSYLPRLGMRTARLEGIPFTGSFVSEKETRVSEKNIPPPSEDLIKNSKGLLNGSVDGVVVQKEYLLGKSSLSNSFYDTLIIVSSNDTVWNLANVDISGKILLHSKFDINIHSTANLQNVLISGRKINIKEGFSGSVQIFASDTIIVEESVKLTYPSNICVVGSEYSKPYVLLKSNSQVHGAVWVWSEYNTKTNSPICIIESNAIVKGQVYSSGMIQHSGEVWGSLITDLFTLRTSYAYYENYLNNATITNVNFPEFFACLPFVFDYPNMQFIEWVF